MVAPALSEIRLQETLDAAYRRYMKELATRALYRVRDPAVCEDLVQDTFMKTWMYLVKGGKIETMRAFLHHVLSHLIVDEYRKHKPLSLDALIENGYEVRDTHPERLYERIDSKNAALSICRLPKKYQKVMRMRYVEGLSLKEMSAIARQSRNTVAVQAHRGLEKLRLLQNS